MFSGFRPPFCKWGKLSPLNYWKVLKTLLFFRKPARKRKRVKLFKFRQLHANVQSFALIMNILWRQLGNEKEVNSMGFTHGVQDFHCDERRRENGGREFSFEMPHFTVMACETCIHDYTSNQFPLVRQNHILLAWCWKWLECQTISSGLKWDSSGSIFFKKW